MSFASATSCVTLAVQGYEVNVESHISDGLVGMTITGLADTSINESRDRVRAAMLTAGVPWPQKRITVGLSPAWLPKHGSGLDLAIAISIFAAEHEVDAHRLKRSLWCGELGLDGRVRGVNGVLTAAITAQDLGLEFLIVAHEDGWVQQLVQTITVVAVHDIRQALTFIQGGHWQEWASASCVTGELVEQGDLDFQHVRGQARIKQACEVAAAGAHHMALLGPPGVGKTLLASRIPSILPPLTYQEALEVAAVASARGHQPHVVDISPPFAAPHHTSSYAALVGGGSGSPTIGLISQAHRGVLFLDEAPEFATNVLDALRQPLESGVVTLHRKTFTIDLPARFQLVLAANPCPCGYALDATGRCQCSPSQRRRYLMRISGPLLDRIDVRVIVDPPHVADFADVDVLPEASSTIRERVVSARQRMQHRLSGTPWKTNAEVPGSALRDVCSLPENVTRFLSSTLERGRQSVRGMDRVARVTWTIADLADQAQPTVEHAQSALQLREADQRWPQ